MNVVAFFEKSMQMKVAVAVAKLPFFPAKSPVIYDVSHSCIFNWIRHAIFSICICYLEV